MQRKVTVQSGVIQGKLMSLVSGAASPLYRGSRLDRPGMTRGLDGQPDTEPALTCENAKP
jgi:hypothetical protein